MAGSTGFWLNIAGFILMLAGVGVSLLSSVYIFHETALILGLIMIVLGLLVQRFTTKMVEGGGKRRRSKGRSKA